MFVRRVSGRGYAASDEGTSRPGWSMASPFPLPLGTRLGCPPGHTCNRADAVSERLLDAAAIAERWECRRRGCASRRARARCRAFASGRRPVTRRARRRSATCTRRERATRTRPSSRKLDYSSRGRKSGRRLPVKATLAMRKPRVCGAFSTPRVGLEPTTLRLTAGCSAN
jgi:hypothetical protein